MSKERSLFVTLLEHETIPPSLSKWVYSFDVQGALASFAVIFIINCWVNNSPATAISMPNIAEVLIGLQPVRVVDSTHGSLSA